MEGLFASWSHYLTTPGSAKNVGYRKRYGAVMNAGGFLPGVHSQGLCKYQCAQRCRMRIRGGGSYFSWNTKPRAVNKVMGVTAGYT